MSLVYFLSFFFLKGMVHFLPFFANEKEHVSAMSSTLQRLLSKPRFSQGYENSLFHLTGFRTRLAQLVCFPMRPLNGRTIMIKCMRLWFHFTYRGVRLVYPGDFLKFAAVVLHGKRFVERRLKCFCKVFWKWERELKESLLPKARIVFILGLAFITALWPLSSFRGSISGLCVHRNRMFSMWIMSESFESFTAGKLGPHLRDSA